VHLSAYGRENERKARPGYDYLMQAEAGFMSVTGEPGDPPSRMGLSIVDFITGLTGAVGLLAAVIGARESGRGCDVDSCLFDVALHQLSYPATWYLNEGTEIKRMVRSAHPSIAPAQLFTTADGWIMIMCMKDKFWNNLLETMDRMDLATDPRFASAEGRRRNLPDLSAVLDQEFSTFTTANWVEKLATRLPAAPVYDIAEALENPFVEATGMLENISHPDRSDFRMLANPLRINGQRLPGKVCSKLGQDTASILEMLGIPAEQHGNGMADEA
jgi:crotonobetainyl-CoA:carnitine CoA-transferase CaiB-like acyl-CoA transferase